ncbi:MAG: TMCO1/EMC3 family protein, partial [Methanoregula sp.]|nr:TMCO1/EMC3 family protein [Methanoregula sp.]
VMKEQLELSQQQFKPMTYILVLSVPIFFWLLYRLAQVQTTITMPYLGTHSLTDAVIWIIPSWIFWYMICSITLSQIIRKSLNIGGL